MKSRPILFSAPMVRELLDGSKTQTRRVAKTEIVLGREALFAPRPGNKHAPTFLLPDAKEQALAFCPYGQPGDQLWVRETHCAFDVGRVHYRADYQSDPVGEKEHGVIWKPSIHMPRWASRITLEIVSVRLERLQDISRGDAMAEGCPFPNMAQGADPRNWYADLWNSINGPDTWATNPWVWVVEFKRVTP